MCNFIQIALIVALSIALLYYLRKSTRDAAERKKSEQIKDEFVSIVSHELRTPLAITREGVSLLLDGVAGALTDQQSGILKTSLKNMDRLARIINDLLDLTKIESGGIRLKRHRIDFAQIVNEAVSLFEARAKEKGLSLRPVLPAGGLCVFADRDRILQVLSNLISNAIKFTDHGLIEVSASDKVNEIECVVPDTGRGIAKENIARLFFKFQQFGGAGKGKEKGTGLGLAIAKQILDAHNGKIEVASKEKAGTTFKLSFRIAKYA